MAKPGDNFSNPIFSNSYSGNNATGFGVKSTTPHKNDSTRVAALTRGSYLNDESLDLNDSRASGVRRINSQQTNDSSGVMGYGEEKPLSGGTKKTARSNEGSGVREATRNSQYLDLPDPVHVQSRKGAVRDGNYTVSQKDPGSIAVYPNGQHPSEQSILNTTDASSKPSNSCLHNGKRMGYPLARDSGKFQY